jgi:hypothetical protein
MVDSSTALGVDKGPTQFGTRVRDTALLVGLLSQQHALYIVGRYSENGLLDSDSFAWPLGHS